MIVVDNSFCSIISEGTYVALGSFDGLHKGHLTLINKVIELSKKNNSKGMVYTFKNHPLSLINPNYLPKLIMDNNSKITLLDKLGLDLLCLVDFNNEIMSMEPGEFIKSLVHRFNIKGIIVGFNYRFGYKNSGDTDLLKRLSNELGFELHVMDAYMYNNEPISSTRIRNEINQGNVEEATKMLGYPFTIRGNIVDGKKLGRTIGFPTANIEVPTTTVIPKIGVYYTNIKILGKTFKGITSVGNNPTVNGKNITIETYILDFNKDIYGLEVELFFVKRIRDEKKFANLNELKNQLEKDKDFAKLEDIILIL